MLRIAYNALDIPNNYRGGIFTYAMGLLQGFAAHHQTEIELGIYCTGKNRHLFEDVLRGKSIEVHEFQGLSRGARAIRKVLINSGSTRSYQYWCNKIWRNVSTHLRGRYDFLYTPTTLASFFNSPIPQVISLHDVQHFHFPVFFTTGEIRRRNLSYRASVEVASFLQASSEYMANDFKTQLGFEPKRIWRIPEGVNIDRFVGNKAKPLDSKYHTPGPYLLMPAQLWPHKNHKTIISALNLVRQKTGKEIPTIFTGARYSGGDAFDSELRSSSLKQAKHFGLVPFEDLVSLIQNAYFVISCSLHESSSLPLFEGAAAGTGLIASDIDPHIEMARDFALNIFQREDSVALADLLIRLWGDGAIRSQQIEKNTEVVQKYSWVQIAKQYIEHMKRVQLG